MLYAGSASEKSRLAALAGEAGRVSVSVSSARTVGIAADDAISARLADLLPFVARAVAVDGYPIPPEPGNNLFNDLWPALRAGVSFFAPLPRDSVTNRGSADTLAIAYSLAF